MSPPGSVSDNGPAIAQIIARIRQMGIGILLVEAKFVMALRLADYAYVLETGRYSLRG